MEPGKVMKKDLRVYVRNDRIWSTHKEDKVSKAVLLLHYVKPNASSLTLSHPKLCLYKSLILPINNYASPCFHISKTSIRKLEIFRKCVLERVLDGYASNYLTHLTKSNKHPLSFFCKFQIYLNSAIFIMINDVT